jgi:vitamin B12 transporter
VSSSRARFEGEPPASRDGREVMFEFGRVSLGAATVAALLWPVAARGDDPPPSEVDVRGGPRMPARAPKDPTVAGAVIDREEVASPGLRAAEVLRSQVGLQITETGGAGAPATASVRGATAAQLPVYLAGVSLNDDVGGAADLSRIPLWLVDRVEIYRGNAPLEADRLGIGGAIFFEPHWPRGPEAGAGVTLGSWGSRASWVRGAVGDDRAAVLAGVSVEAADNDYPYADDHGTLLAPTGTSIAHMTNADVTTYDAWVLGRARLGGGDGAGGGGARERGDGASIDAFVNGTHREQGVPTLALVPSREARATFDRAVGGARALVPAGPASGVELDSSVSLARADYRDPLEELALATHRLTLAGSRVEQRAALRTEATDALTVRLGIDVASEDLARDDDTGAALRARRLSSRVAASARQWLGDALSVQVLVAAQCDGTSEAAASTCDTFAPVGRVGAAWTQPTWELFANASRYVRVPTLGELYGLSVIVHGNPMLVAESGLGVDAGGRWSAPRGVGVTGARAPWAYLGGFARWTDDLVSYVRSSEGYVEPFNVGQARVAGAEAQLGAGVWRWIAVDVSGTLLDPRDVTPGRRTVNDVLPFQSRAVVVPRVVADFRDVVLGPIRRVRAEVRWVYQSSRYADAAGLAVIPDQGSVDAELLAQTAGGALTARLRVADLLDSPRFDVVGFPLPGRSAFLSLEAQW